MSGYFARLAAQMSAPQAAHSATPAAVAPIERHVEVEVPASVPMPHGSTAAQAPTGVAAPFAAFRTQSTAAAPQQPTPLSQRTVPHGKPSAIEAAPATQPATPQRHAGEPQPMSFAAETSMPVSPASPSRHVDPQVLAAAARVDSDPMQPPVAPRHERATPASSMAIEAPRAHAVPPAEPSAEPRAVLAPPPRLATAQAITSGPAPAIADAGRPPRTEIRIGTIALEVHTPPAPAPRPVPQPAAAPTPAPPRFSPQRHYLRWS